MKIVTLMYAALLLAGASLTPAQAQSAQAAPQTPPVPETPAPVAPELEPAARADDAPVASRGGSDEDPNERICKYVVQTGSRMGNKQCRTRAYWAEMELAARNKMREIDSQPIPVRGN